MIMRALAFSGLLQHQRRKVCQVRDGCASALMMSLQQSSRCCCQWPSSHSLGGPCHSCLRCAAFRGLSSPCMRFVAVPWNKMTLWMSNLCRYRFAGHRGSRNESVLALPPLRLMGPSGRGHRKDGALRVLLGLRVGSYADQSTRTGSCCGITASRLLRCRC